MSSNSTEQPRRRIFGIGVRVYLEGPPITEDEDEELDELISGELATKLDDLEQLLERHLAGKPQRVKVETYDETDSEMWRAEL